MQAQLSSKKSIVSAERDNSQKGGRSLPAVPVLQNGPVQKMDMEEKEPVQGRFVIQKKDLEDEPPIQGRFMPSRPFQFKEAPVQKKPNNTGLPDNLKEGVENLSGYSMDDVKVYYNSDKPAQLQALAYAQGTDIHVAPGQEKHLPHEAWHVVQQKQGRVHPTMQMKGGVSVNDDKGLESEADLMGAEVTQLKSKLIKSVDSKTKIDSSRNEIIQPKWIESKEGLMWDQLINGVQWYSQQNGDMSYEIKDIQQIKMGETATLKRFNKQLKPRSFWLENSVAGFDILGNLDNSIVKSEQVNDNVLNTSTLKPYDSASQFKDIYYHGNGKLLSVMKTGKSSDVLVEVTALNKIATMGLLTPNASIVDVVHKGVKTMGILMDKVDGIFVDIAKLSNKELISHILNEAAAGRSVDTSEMGLVKEMNKMKNPSSPTPLVLKQLIADLELIYESKKCMVINDLQIIVRSDGRAVIIDPQWVGSETTLTSLEEINFINKTYNKVEQAIKELSGEKKKNIPKTIASRFLFSQGGGPNQFGPPTGDSKYFT